MLILQKGATVTNCAQFRKEKKRILCEEMTKQSRRLEKCKLRGKRRVGTSETESNSVKRYYKKKYKEYFQRKGERKEEERIIINWKDEMFAYRDREYSCVNSLLNDYDA